jgi:hypothetical protein
MIPRRRSENAYELRNSGLSEDIQHLEILVVWLGCWLIPVRLS